MSYANYNNSMLPPERSFSDVLTEQIRSTPWVGVSLAVHVLIAIMLSFVSSNAKPTEVQPELQMAMSDQLIDELEEPPLDVVEVDQPIIESEDVAEVVAKDAPEDDHNETDNDKETDSSEGEEDAVSDKPFDNANATDAIGLGPGGGSPWGDRVGGNQNLRGPTGGRRTRLIVDNGLIWLAQHQSPDGRWDSDGFMANGDPQQGKLCDGKGNAMYDVGTTGLALLAFLGAGHTHREGKYKDNVRQGLKYLRSIQDAQGCFGSRGDPHFTYSHGVAALAMAEAYGMTKSGIWKGSAQKGIDFVMQCQNPYKAWRYGERPGENDVSVTGWMVMALKSAKVSGLEVNDTAMTWAHDYVKEMTDEETGRTGYTKRGERPVRSEGRIEQFPGSESESLTGVGMLVRIFCGEDPAKSSMLKAGAELCSKRLPVWEPKQGKVDMYYWYYATLAMFQVGGPEWSAWNEALKPAVIESQRKDKGNFLGSWDPVGPWGEDGGRVYSTALMTMCMQVYYRYGRVFGTK